MIFRPLSRGAEIRSAGAVTGDPPPASWRRTQPRRFRNQQAGSGQREWRDYRPSRAGNRTWRPRQRQRCGRRSPKEPRSHLGGRYRGARRFRRRPRTAAWRTSLAAAAGSPRTGPRSSGASPERYRTGLPNPGDGPEDPRGFRRARDPEGSRRPVGASVPRREGGCPGRKADDAQRHLCLPKRQRQPAGGKRCLAKPSDRDEEQTPHRDRMTAPGEPRRASAFRTKSARLSRRLRPPSTLACRSRVARKVNASKEKTRESASFLCITRVAVHKTPTIFPPNYPQGWDCIAISKRCLRIVFGPASAAESTSPFASPGPPTARGAKARSR